MKNFIKKLCVYMLYYSKLYKLIYLFKYRLGNEPFTILVYHSFSNGDTNPFSIDYRLFEKQLMFLKKHYRILRLGDVIKKLKTGEPLEKKTLCITIDDGFLDNYNVAYPILKRHALPATIFIATGYINGSDQKINNYGRHQINKADTYNRNDIYKLPQLSMMSWKQIKEISNDVIEIGAHTINHPILTKVPINVAKEEIETSKIEIETILNKKIDLFAFPNGMKNDYNDELCSIVQNSGYNAAFTVEWGLNYSSDDLYLLKRIPISSLDIPEFAVKINCLVSDP